MFTRAPCPLAHYSGLHLEATACGGPVPTQTNSHVPLKGHCPPARESDVHVASRAGGVLPSRASSARAALPSAAPALLLYFPHSVSSVLDRPFFLLPFFLEALGYLFSCLIFSLPTHLFSVSSLLSPGLHRFLC